MINHLIQVLSQRPEPLINSPEVSLDDSGLYRDRLASNRQAGQDDSMGTVLLDDQWHRNLDHLRTVPNLSEDIPIQSGVSTPIPRNIP